MSTSSSGHQRLFKQKRNSNLQKNISQYNGKSKNESTPNSANFPDQMLVNSQNLEVEQLKNNGLIKQGNIVQQKRINTEKTSDLNEEACDKQPAEIKMKKSFEPERNKEKEHGRWSDKHTGLGPGIKSGKMEGRNGRHYVFTSCNRETCRKNVGEHNLNTEKLTEIINNSIKEAIQSIVKETPNILRMKQDSLLSNEQPLLSSNSSKKPEKIGEKPGGQIKNLVAEDRSTNIFNGFHKKTDPLSVNTNNVYENQRISSDVNFIKNNEIIRNYTVNKCNKITCPYLAEKLESKSNKIIKSMKSLKKPLKHSATTDNRKMTGNVNIYICSEAGNEKENRESRESGSVTNTETDIKASVSTISSNKLIANLLERRRRLQKSSLQCLCPKSETDLESRIEEVPQEENHLNDVVTGSYVPPPLDPVLNYETAITNTDHENDIKEFEKSNKNFDRLNNNGGDHSCTALNCPYIKGRSMKQRNYIKNNYPMNVKWCTKNNSIIANGTVDDNYSCTKTVSPYTVLNGRSLKGSVTSVKQSDVYNANNNKRKDRFGRKWQESEIEEVCIYCTPRRNKKLEQCPRTKLNNMLKKCIKGTKQRDQLFKNIGTSQRRNCAEQCFISNSTLKEEIEVNNTNLNEEDLPEKINSQRKEVYVASSYGNNGKASVDKSNVKDDVTIVSAKSEHEKSSLLLSSINYEKKYQDKPPEKIGSEAHLSKDKDQSHQKYISNAKIASPVMTSSIITSPFISDKRLDTVTTQKVKSASRSVEQTVIMEEDKLTSSVASAPFSKIEMTIETEKEEKEELDGKTGENSESKENRKESFFQRVVKRVKQFIGISNVADSMNDKKRRGCGSSCRAHPRNFVNDEDVEEMKTARETILIRQSSKDVIIGQDKMKDDGYKVESPKDVFQINKENASKAKLIVLIAKKKMLQQSNRNKETTESNKIKISKDTLETQEDAQVTSADVTSVTKANESKSSKDTVKSITDHIEGSRRIKKYNSGESKNLESFRNLQSSNKISAKNSQIIKDTKSSEDTIQSITDRIEESRRIQKYNSGESKNLESFRNLQSSNKISAKNSQIIKDTKSSEDTIQSITDRIEESRRIQKYNSGESKNLESFRNLQSSNKISAKNSQIIKDTKSSKDTVQSITDRIEGSRRIQKYNSGESKNLESFRNLQSSNKISAKNSQIIKDTKSSKDTVQSITDRIEGSRRIQKYNSGESKNLESFRNLQSSNKISAKNSQIIKDTKSSKDTVQSITDRIEGSRRIQKYNSGESKNLESFRNLQSSNKISAKNSQIIKDTKSSKDTVQSITDRIEGSRRIQKYNSGESKNLESFRNLQSSNKISAKNSQIIKDTKSSKDTVQSITDRIKGSRRIQKYNSGESKNFESFRSLQSSNNISAKDSHIIKDTKSFKDTVKSITNHTQGSRRIKKCNSGESKNLESFRSLQSSNKISATDSQITKDTKNSVTNSKEIETQTSFTNSLKIIIPKDSKNVDSPKVSPDLNTTKESVNLQVSEDPEESSVSTNEDNNVNRIEITENSESLSIEDDDIYHSYTEFIQSKNAKQIDRVCNCKEPEKDFQVCIICCCPEDNCSCNNRNNIKTMICVNPSNSTHCDNPHERCTCQNPVCNCFHHNLTKNNYNCNCDKITDVATCNCNMNNNVSVQDDDNMIYVTAWKPTKDIEKYFSRTLEDFKNLPKECCCFDNKKPYGSEELPYQRLGVFSKVMTELQEKINQSVTCKECKNAPCRCVFNNEFQPITREVAEDKTKSFDQPRSQSQSPSSCKCTLNTCNSLSWNPSSSKVKDRYKPTSCYCRQSRSAKCRSHTKCFYCKCSPCRCTISRETSRSRSCKCDNSVCHHRDIPLPKMTDTNLQISKNFQCLCTTSRDPCSF
ncbi:protein PF14_0175 isoform X2 [Cephus cinctus]|uniref:Protein PF14_0175 isoform X2 n=1 Tax=Cephus cinctus TaxID=211228 RepID=A0AAJ7W5G6_CEPCN|nr:protein PF14_0175 isoform X2 [Cephus cinctus]